MHPEPINCGWVGGRQGHWASKAGGAVDCVSFGSKGKKACQGDIPKTTLEHNLQKSALLGKELRNLRA